MTTQLDYKSTLQACVDDLLTYQHFELVNAARYYGLPRTDMQTLCRELAGKFMAQYIHLARMPDLTDADKKLVGAVQRGDKNAVQTLIAEGANPGAQDSKGVTVLMIAVMREPPDIVDILLNTGKANPGATDNGGNTALIIAILRGKLDIANALLATDNANPGAQQTTNGNTALMYAVQKGYLLEIVKALLATGKARPAVQNNAGNTALMFATQAENLEMVNLILATGKVNPAIANDLGFTALMLAVQKGILGIVKALLATGDATPAAQSKIGDTALIYAVRGGDLEMVNTILATGEANPAAQTNTGFTALMIAVQKRNLEMVKALLATGEANPGARNNRGNTALILASGSGNLEMVKGLLNTGDARPQVQNQNGTTALMEAVIVGDPEIVKTILATGKANVRAQDNKDQTALTYAKIMKNKANDPEKIEQYAEIERILALASLKTIPRKKLARPKEGPLWMHLCASLLFSGMETLRRLAQELDIDIREKGEFKDKRRLCYDLAQNYEELLKIERTAPGEEYEHKGVTCDNDTSLAGEEWPEIAPEDLFVDQYNYCFSFDDIEGIMQADQLHPISRIPMAKVKLKDGSSLLATYEARKKTRAVGIEEERLKKMRQVHTIITNPTQALMSKLAELIDEHPGGPGQRNYFDVSTLEGWEKKTRKEYQQFLTSLKNEELVQDNEPVLKAPAKFTSGSFMEFLETLMQSINEMPQDNKQTYRLLLKIMLEEE